MPIAEPNTILNDVSCAALMRANELNQERVYALLADVPGVTMTDESEYLSIRSDIPHPLANAVLRVRMTAEKAPASIKAAAAPYRKRGLPMTWLIGPSSSPANLHDRLLDCNMVRSGSMPAMGIDLSEGLKLPAMPPGVQISEATDPVRRAEWTAVCSKASSVSEDVILLFDSVGLFAEGGSRSQISRFSAYLNAECVGASMLFLDGSTAGIYCVAVLEHARGRGIGAAITAAALVAARQAGYRAAILQASDMGTPVYRRLGFTETGRFDMYRDRHGSGE